MTTTAAAMETTDVSSTPQVALLREWSYPSPVEPPVAPAVVLNEEEEEEQEASPTKLPQTAQGYSYPVATFVSNLVRSSVGHIYPIGESVNDESDRLSQRSEEIVPVTSIRTEPGVAVGIDATTLRSVLSEPGYGDEFDEADFVLLDGDLVAVPSPPPNQEELEAFEKKNCRMKQLKRFGKWIRKRTSRKTSPRNAEETITLSCETENVPQGRRRNKRNKKKRRRRIDSSDDVEMQVVQEVALADGYPGTAPPTAEAHLIGNADQLVEAGVLPACASADAYIEEDDKIDELASTFYVQAEKVDKVDNYLQGAIRIQEEEEEECATDLESSVATISSESSSQEDSEGATKPQHAPLSKASASDEDVYNDTLKVVMVGAPHVGKSSIARALRKRNSRKARRRSTYLGVDVQSWTASAVDRDDKHVRFSVWDVNDKAAAGTHPATQSLFFSEESLYILVWDMAGSNELAQRRIPEEESEEEDDIADDFLLERLNRQADAALEVDIQDRVLNWVDQIASTARNSVILPVATKPDGMDECEAQRRCSMMRALLMEHIHSLRGEGVPRLVNESSVLRINPSEGVEELKDIILDIAGSNGEQQLFQHVGQAVPSGTVEVLEAIRSLRSDNHKVVLVDHLVAAGLSPSNVNITESLQFLSRVGEVLYFGSDDQDDVLSRYVILCRKWLVSALSCILCSDLRNELTETRNFMNMQCEYTGQFYAEGDVTRTLIGESNSNCPVLSSSEASMLWQSMSFMREATDKSAHGPSATSSECVFEFLKRLLVYSGIFVPLTMPTDHETETDEVFFVPSLLPQAEPNNIWTYKSSQSWMTTLCHSWLLRDGAPSNMMERVAVSLLEDLYGFSRSTVGACYRSNKFAVAEELEPKPLQEGENVAGQIKIHQIMCWKSSLVVNIGCFFEDPETGVIRESVIEVFVSLADQHSRHCVASTSMAGGLKKLIVSGKGQSGHDGRKLWKGGYGLVLDSIKASVSFMVGNVERQIACPECIAGSHHSDATNWSWDCVRSAVECGNPNIRCIRGHLVDANILCGACKTVPPVARHHANVPPCVSKPVSSLLGGVVVVGLWDGRRRKIRNVGSGFVVDSKHGLVVTASHILFDMSERRRFGSPYWGLKDAKAVIGVIPDGEETAVFRYFADIVAYDVHNMDACVLRITTKFESDVTGEGDACADQPEIPLTHDVEALQRENLQQLKMTRKCELEEKVRILGFNQGGEGILEQGKHVNRDVDFAKGYVCKKFKAVLDDSVDVDSTSSSESSTTTPPRYFTPREEIVVICPTISGHSGGPCVNEEGKVIGILSRADPTDRHRCYLVPTGELKKIVKLAKAHCSRKCLNELYS